MGYHEEYLTEEELREAEQQIEYKDYLYINDWIESIVKTAEEMEYESDTLSINNFGNSNLKIVIEKEFMSEDSDTSYNIEVYAPQPKIKLISDRKLQLGYEYNLTKEELRDILKGIMTGNEYTRITNCKSDKYITVSDAIKNFNKKYNQTLER